MTSFFYPYIEYKNVNLPIFFLGLVKEHVFIIKHVLIHPYFLQTPMFIVLTITVCVVCGCVRQDMPRVTLPGSTSQTLQQEPPTPQPKSSLASKSSVKQKQKEQEPKPAGGTRSWLGGIWNRFALRATNQMKLPDDKNPSVSVGSVYNSVHKSKSVVIERLTTRQCLDMPHCHFKSHELILVCRAQLL